MEARELSEGRWIAEVGLTYEGVSKLTLELLDAQNRVVQVLFEGQIKPGLELAFEVEIGEPTESDWVLRAISPKDELSFKHQLVKRPSETPELDRESIRVRRSFSRR